MRELYHHGILGQKWGVRRYRNKDGSLTDLGKRRLSSESKGRKVSFDENGNIDTKSKGNEQKATDHIHRYASDSYRTNADVANSISTASRTASGLFRRSADNRRNEMARKEDVSNISDKELQQRVNRMNLERNYYRLKSEDIKTGRDYVADTLTTIGELVVIASAASTIAANIHKLKTT